MGPNSTYTPSNNSSASPFQQFINAITGNNATTPSGTTSVRGSTTPKTNPGLASPTQYRRGLNTATSAGGTNSVFQNFMNLMNGQYASNGYAQQSMAPGSLSGVPLQSNNPVTSSLVLGTNMPSYYQGPGKGINGNPMPVDPNTGTRLGVNSRMGGYQSRAYAPFFNQQQLGLPAQQFSYAPQGQPNSYTPYAPGQPRQFSYAPQGQQNSPYAQINPASYTKPAPFLTAANLATPTYGTPTQYGSYANGTPKTAQESFQQGNKKVGKRWWIGSGKTHGESVAAPVIPEYNPLDFQALNQQQTTWRV
jgi:hypothetical protein